MRKNHTTIPSSWYCTKCDRNYLTTVECEGGESTPRPSLLLLINKQGDEDRMLNEDRIYKVSLDGIILTIVYHDNWFPVLYYSNGEECRTASLIDRAIGLLDAAEFASKTMESTTNEKR